jgi:hypothetical protein
VSTTAHIYFVFNIYFVSFCFQEIVVRVLFILGNLTTKSDETRHNLYFAKASTRNLLTVFKSYFERNVEVRYFCFSGGDALRIRSGMIIRPLDALRDSSEN